MQPATDVICLNSSTGFPFWMPLRQVVYRPFWALIMSPMPFASGWTIMTLPSKPAFSLRLSTIQSTNALRKLPSPNCRTLMGLSTVFTVSTMPFILSS